MYKTKMPIVAIAGKTGIVALVVAFMMSALLAGCDAARAQNWRSKLAAELPVLGHRNWILIADSAYPAQSRPGIETIATGAGQFEVLKAVLKAIDDASHVRANVYLDAELQYVSENDAPGVDAYRRRLATLLAKHKTKSLLHERLLARLDETAKMFNVLVLKTNLTIPYTSVFLELDCGYWGPEEEQKMRRTIQQAL